MFNVIEPTLAERSKQLPGDLYIDTPAAIMDRAFTLPGNIEQVWPWFMQLGKQRAGWYFPRSIERFIPSNRRGIRFIDPTLQQLAIGERIDDWGGKKGYLEVFSLDAPHSLVYISTRGKMSMSWAITLWPDGDRTRVIIRLRMRSGGSGRFIKVGDIFDKLTIAGLASGLNERLLAEVKPTPS
jgi:hypothetical protein